MTIAAETFPSPLLRGPRLTLEDYLNYDDGTDTRYELVDGVLVAMGAENPLNSQITGLLLITFFQLGIPPYRLAIGHQLGISPTQATARQPDFIVHSEASEASITADGKLLRFGQPAPLLVVEIVSNSDTDKKSRDRDYLEKRQEYAARGIPEYWIVDPIAQVVLVLTLTGSEYREVRFMGEQTIVSPTFPDLVLAVAQLLRVGR